VETSDFYEHLLLLRQENDDKYWLHAGENGKGTVKVDIKCGTPFEPVNVYKMLQAIDFEAFKVWSI